MSLSSVSSLTDPEKNYSLSQDAALLETLKTQQVYRGSVFGFENFFIENNPIRPDSVIVSASYDISSLLLC